MKTAFFLLLLLIQSSLLAQYHPKTSKLRDGSSAKKCFHKNGKISTIETWDKEQRTGSLKGYSSKGTELFSYDLRRYGGHASAQLTYYANGQVKRVYYSDAPDGGIQYYHATLEFDLVGNRTLFREDKYPDELIK